jgi:hypothetical protein
VGGGCARAVATRDTDIEKCLRALGRVIYFESSYSIALCVPILPHIAYPIPRNRVPASSAELI